MGKSDNALICQERGFTVGDVIEGDEDGHIARLKIKFIGNDVVVFDEIKKIDGIWQFYEETAQWTLNARDWRVIKPSIALESVEVATVVKIIPTKVWAEKGFSGVVHIKTQHEGEKNPFDFVQINYDYRYTSNSHQQSFAFSILKLLGVEDSDCKITQTTTNITESQKQFISVLEDALMKCSIKFAAYERHHLEKGHSEKANANKAMVDMCQEAMNKSNILQMMS